MTLEQAIRNLIGTADDLVSDGELLDMIVEELDKNHNTLVKTLYLVKQPDNSIEGFKVPPKVGGIEDADGTFHDAGWVVVPYDGTILSERTLDFLFGSAIKTVIVPEGEIITLNFITEVPNDT